jgi:branched-chain amino acid transport system permease protein
VIERKQVVFLGVVALLAALPLFLSKHNESVVTELLIFALFAMSLDIIMGYTGLISFGHAAYFGIGGYVSAYLLLQHHLPLPLAVVAGGVVSALFAWPIGYFSTRATGIYFAMLTLAFAQMLYAIAFKWRSVTGGSDGMVGVPHGQLWFGRLDLSSHAAYYYVVCAILVLSFLICYGVVRSPFGKVLQAIRENERKVEALGLDPKKFKVLAFVIAGFFAGVAGALYSPYEGFASPEVMFWLMSGTILMMVIIGGVGTLVGPMVGAVVFIMVEEILSSYTENWMIFVGIIFVLMVLFIPNGIVGFVLDKWGQRSAPRRQPQPLQPLLRQKERLRKT